MNSLNNSPVPLIQGMNTQEVALVFIITVCSDLPTKVLAASINSGQLNLTEDKGWGKLYKVLFILSPQILFTSYSPGCSIMVRTHQYNFPLHIKLHQSCEAKGQGQGGDGDHVSQDGGGCR